MDTDDVETTDVDVDGPRLKPLWGQLGDAEVLFRCIAGSHLHGTSTPSSDLDAKAVHVPAARDILMQRVTKTLKADTKPVVRSAMQPANTPDDIDVESFALATFLHQVARGEAVPLDILFATQLADRRRLDSRWLAIWDAREHLFSKELCAGLVGYANAQVMKYGLKGSRAAALERVVQLLAAHPGGDKMVALKPMLTAIAAAERHVSLFVQANPSGQDVEMLDVCNKRCPLTVRIKQAHDIYARQLENVGERARRAARNDGVDHKAVGHATRVLLQLLELFEHGHITFPRPEAPWLVRLKLGEVPFAQAAGRLEELFDEVEASAAKAKLPDHPDRDWVENVAARAYAEAVARDESCTALGTG